MNIKEKNLETFNKYLLLPHQEELSYPLLVNSNLNLTNKTMYIGQETNCCINYKNGFKKDVNEIEDYYYNFLLNNARNRDFWKFIKEVLLINNNLTTEVIWSNIFISGKRYEYGLTPYYKELESISLEYNLFLYNYFKPKNTILVTGPKNPYYSNTINFLKETKSCLIDLYPTKNNPVLYDEKNNIIWTYHPGAQNRLGIKEKVLNFTKEKIK